MSDGGVDDVVDVAEGQVVVEEVMEQFADAPQGTMPDEDQTECELADPARGDGEVEQDRIVVGWWLEGVGEGVSCNVLLSVDERAADLGLFGQFGDRDGFGESLDGELLA